MESLAASYPIFFTWILLPGLIFAARTADMSLATLRIVFVAQGRAVLAPLVGFFEALIWLFVIGQALRYLDNPLCVIAYAGGFAAGNAAGLFLERRLAFGRQLVRIVVPRESTPLIDMLRREGYGVTVVDGQGLSGPVEILFTVVWRRDVPRVIEHVRRHDPKAFFSIEDVRRAEEGVFPQTRKPLSFGLDWQHWRQLRKAR